MDRRQWFKATGALAVVATLGLSDMAVSESAPLLRSVYFDLILNTWMVRYVDLGGNYEWGAMLSTTDRPTEVELQPFNRLARVAFERAGVL